MFEGCRLLGGVLMSWWSTRRAAVKHAALGVCCTPMSEAAGVHS